MHWRETIVTTLSCVLSLSFFVFANPTAEHPLEALSTDKEIKIFGVIYPKRFNAAQGEEARYHLLVWKGGTSANALVETPADDLAFHEALVSLGAHPGDNPGRPQAGGWRVPQCPAFGDGNADAGRGDRQGAGRNQAVTNG